MKKLFLVSILTALALSQAGQAGWWRTYGGEGYEMGNCIQKTIDGNFIISGTTDEILWLIKIDTSGNVLWERKYSRSDDMMSRWIEQIEDGGFVVAPRTPSLLKIDSQGDSVWAKNYGIYSYCVQPTIDGGYIVTGGTNGYGYDERFVIVKTDSKGDTLGTRTYNTSQGGAGRGVQQTLDGGYIVVGTTQDISKSLLKTGAGFWLIKTDIQGDSLWSRIYSGVGSDVGVCVMQTSDRGYVAVGYTFSYGSGESGVYFLKTDSLGLLGIAETP